jgi:quercetin dioxygenase-like cupin family protein
MRRLSWLVLLAFCIGAGDQKKTATTPTELPGAATIRHREEVVRNDGRHLWPLFSSAEARMNYFEVTGPTRLHFHPDADHRLYVLEGKALITAGTNQSVAIPGDFIIIPRGVRHRYDLPPNEKRALLLTFDAPPYDPTKTVNLE